MIIEVDDKTGLANTYRSVLEFAKVHNQELDEYYKKKYCPNVKVDLCSLPIIRDLLPEGTSPIKKIITHPSYIVANCENGEVHSLDRIGERQYFKLYK